MLFQIFFILSAIALPQLSLAAETVNLRVVVNGPDQRPIAEAKLELIPLAGGAKQAKAADGNGAAEFSVQDDREYRLRVEANGFAVQERRVSGPDLRQTQYMKLAVVSASQSVTVNASLIAGTTEQIARIPGSVDVLDEKTMKESRLFSMEEALRKVSGIQARPEEGFGLRPNIGIRGLNPTRSTRVLLLEDGVPLSYAPYGDNASYYHPPVDRFDGVEIVKGSGQILYGPMTVGGVVNYVTPSIPAKSSGFVSLTGGNLSYLNAHVRYGGTFRGTGLLIDAVRKQGDGSRTDIRSGLNDVNFKTLSTLTPTQTLSFKANFYTEDSNVTYSGLRLAEYLADPRQNPFRNDFFYGQRFGLSTQHTAQLQPGLILTTTAYGAYFNRDWWRQSSNSAQRPNDSADPVCGGMANLLTTCGNEGRLRTYTTWGLEPRFKWFARGWETDFGLRAHFETQDRQQMNGNFPTSRTGLVVEDNLRKNQALSAYLQPRFNLTSRLSVTPGIRVEHVRYQRTNRLFNNGQGARGETTLTQFVPGVGAAFAATSSLTLFSGVHRGFAPPRNEDIVSNSGGFIDLDPELSWNYEAGARWRAERNTNFSFTFFRMDYSNQIVPASLAGGVGAVLTNGGETVHQGIEVSGRHDFRNIFDSRHSFYLSGAYTWLPVARFDGLRFSGVSGFATTSITGNRLPYAPGTLLNGTLGWMHASGLHAFAEAVHTGRQFGDDLNTVNVTADGQRGALPGYVIFNTTVNAPVEAWKTTFFFTVKNIGNRLAVVDRSRGILPNMPRQIQAGIQYSF
jgi:Fe(3+) dicitrate transport protein